MIQVLIEDGALAERRVSTLMGDKVEPRKKWINENIIFTMEDEFTG
jgi:topoisomerase-4 subunit B